MKRIQQGFTLIELMIVVAIIGILAAVAIPAYQDYIVKSKLSKITSTLDPIKTAIALYFQEQGGFPAEAGAATNSATSTTSGSTPGTGTAWASLGFSVFPSVPNEVKTLTYDGTSAAMSLVLELTNIKAVTVDGVWLAVSPNQSGANTLKATNPTSAVAGGATGTVVGASALQWYYGCAAGNASSVDNVLKRYFVNPSNTPPC